MSDELKKVTFINDIKAGEGIKGIFLLAKAEQAQAKNGPYWRIEVCDATGSLEGKIWSPLSLNFSELPSGKIVEISAKANLYRDKLDLHIEELRVLSEQEEQQINIADFMQASPYNTDEMLEALKQLCAKQCDHKAWRKFLLSVLKDEEISFLFKKAPAAKVMHHAYVGGLLEHTLSVAQLCIKLAEHYSELDHQVLLAGAVCHDLGKIWEMTGGLANGYTDEGYLIGHVNLVLEKLEPFLKKSGLEANLKTHLKHLILSHHGYYEFGAPKLPQTAEAMILHYADNIDAKMSQTKNALSAIAEGESGWSKYLRGLDRSLFKAEMSPTNKIKTGFQASVVNDKKDKDKIEQCALPL